MLTTIGQEWIFLGCLLAGLIMGLTYEAGFILRFCVTSLFKESKSPAPPESASSAKPAKARRKHFNAENLPSLIFTLIIDIIFFGVCLILILTSAKITADGQIFWFSVAAYLLGFIFERITLGIIVAKFINMIYNGFIKVFDGLKKIKFFNKLFR